MGYEKYLFFALIACFFARDSYAADASEVDGLTLNPNLYAKFLIYYRVDLLVRGTGVVATPRRVEFSDHSAGILTPEGVCTIGAHSMLLNADNIRAYQARL